MRSRGKIVIVLALLVVALAARHPTAKFELLTHDIGDPMPARVEAAADLGLLAVSIVVTWTRHLRA